MGGRIATAWGGPAALTSIRSRLVRSRRALPGWNFLLHHVDDPAVGAHLESIERAGRGEHRVTGQSGEHVADHLFGAQRLAAADAGEDRGLVEHTWLARGSGQQQPRLERDRIFRAGRRAQTALHASGLDEAQLGPFRLGMVEDGALRTGPDAGETHGAGVAID